MASQPPASPTKPRASLSPLRGGARKPGAPLSPRALKMDAAARPGTEAAPAGGWNSRLADCMSRLKAASTTVSAAAAPVAPTMSTSLTPDTSRAASGSDLASLAAQLSAVSPVPMAPSPPPVAARLPESSPPAALAPPPPPPATPSGVGAGEKAVLAFALASAREEAQRALRRATAAEAAAAASESARSAASESLAVMAAHHGRLVASLEAERAERRRAEASAEAARAALLERCHVAEAEAMRLTENFQEELRKAVTQALARGGASSAPPAAAAAEEPASPPPAAQHRRSATHEDGPPPPPPPPPTPWAVRRLRDAESRKSRGNALFHEGSFEAAAAEYSAGISAAPGATAAAGGGGAAANRLRAVLYSNRAASLQALGRLLDAASDCSVALSLDPGYSKARARRADVFYAMGDFPAALAELRALSAASDGADASDGEAATVRAKLREVEARCAAKGEGAAGPDFYAVLGVPLSCGAAEVKAAFRALALRHHPDKALAEGGAALRGAQESLFVLLSQAHSTLSDPVLRKRYDALRAARERAF